MAQQVFGPAAVVSVLNRAFTNTSPSNAVFNNQLVQAGTTEASQYAFAESFGATFAVGKTAAELSALVMANMGLDNQLLADALTDYITVHGTNKIGIIAYQLGTLLSPLENDATYGAAAKAWNAEVTAAYEYSADPSNTVPSTSDTNGNEAGKNFVLTTGQDVRTGTSGADFFRGVAGNALGNQDQTTLNSSDILDGGFGEDTLILNLTGNGNYQGGARIKNIETLKLGTNLGAATFDYNVNAGQNEITEVATIVADQINVNEALTVNNILKTGDALPTLAWVNEAGSQAGTVTANYRASAVAGATDQNIVLENVMAVNADATTGRLNIGGSVETFTITSSGTTTNTLNSSTNNDGRAADLVSGSNADGNDNGALTKVVVKGEQAFGRAATVVTNDIAGENNFGLTNRTAGSDLGLNTQASASNLISVAGTVTEIDATEANGGVAMRFVGRNDGAAVNVTFKGGKAADYIEFERGNVNAAGGEGNDTFAFVNNSLTSFDFGSADSIVGGVGIDTIQLGVNGIGSVVANTTEFNNKTGIDVLDLRGNSNTVTLADAFVSSADAGTFIVRTDKIAQTSDTSTANTAPSNANNAIAVARENASVNTIVLTELADNRAIEFIGGSGSDRVVVDNASANQYTKLDGGTNDAANGAFDSLTVVNTAVLDAADVANIKGFELLNLVENTVGNNTFNVTLSEAFLLGNSTASTALTIASVANTYGQKLNAGDVVNLEISDLLSAGAAKASIAGRIVNVQDLIAAGVTVNFQQNGTTVSTNAAPAALTANLNLTVAPTAALLNDVPGGSAAVPPVVGGGAGGGTTGNTFTLNAANGVLSTTANVNATPAAIFLTANGDVINATSATLSGATITDATAGDNDTLNLVLNAAIVGTAPTIQRIENINIESYGAGALNFATVLNNTSTTVTGTAFTATNVAAAQTITLSGVSGAQSYTLADATGGTDAITFNLAGTVAGAGLTTVGAIESVNLNVTAASNLALTAVAATSTVNVTGTAALTLSDNTNTNFSINAGTFGGALAYSQLVASSKTLTGSAQADTFTFNTVGTLTAADVINGGNGIDVVTTSGYTTTTDLNGITNVETLNLTGANLAYSYTTVDTLVAFGQTLTVNAANATGTSTLTFAGNAETNGAFSITGTANNDSVTGGANADTINGGAGNDTITGGAGADVLTGGAGADTFVVTAQTTAAGIDWITDFVGGTDVLKTGITPATAVLTDLTATDFGASANLTAAAIAAVTAAEAATTGNYASAGDAVTFKFAGKTYITVNDAANTTFVDGTDVLVEITGITGTLVIGDIIA